MFSLNNVFLILCGVMQLLSVAFVWLFVLELRSGVAIDGFAAYKFHWEYLFIMSIIMEIILWITDSGIQHGIELLLIAGMLMWIVSSVFAFVLSIGKKMDKGIRFNIRIAVKAAVTNSIILGVLSWVFFV